MEWGAVILEITMANIGMAVLYDVMLFRVPGTGLVRMILMGTTKIYKDMFMFSCGVMGHQQW